MTHLKTDQAKRNYIKRKLDKASSKDLDLIYRATERICKKYKKK
ncbi:MAG: hypothetical protein ACOCRX_04180 [Candidatus Woesearchaeota archaeon]